MFSALRQNSVIYILDKKDTPALRKGQVTAVSSPRPKASGLYSNPLDTVVDITVKCDGGQEVFKNIPSSLGVANDGNIVLSETREAMCAEVESMLSVSRQVIDSVPYHEKVAECCDAMLKELNPQFAREREREEKIAALETKIGGIETSIGDMRQMLAKALDKV